MWRPRVARRAECLDGRRAPFTGLLGHKKLKQLQLRQNAPGYIKRAAESIFHELDSSRDGICSIDEWRMGNLKMPRAYNKLRIMMEVMADLCYYGAVPRRADGVDVEAAGPLVDVREEGVAIPGTAVSMEADANALLHTLDLNAELSLTLCDGPFIRGLNTQWRGKDSETDVLSFPMEGVSIALDIAVNDKTQEIVDALNREVIELGGRIYLAKDAFTRRAAFENMEPRLAQFASVRRRYDPSLRIRSRQSIRLLDPPARDDSARDPASSAREATT